MPMALPVLAGAFLAAGSIAAVTLGTAFVVAGLAITWAAVLTVTGVALMAISALARKTPKPDSGSQLQQKLDPQAPVPIIYGRTAVGGIITWRGTYGSKNKFYGIVTALSAGGPIAGVEAYRAGDLPVTWSGNPATGMAGVFYAGTFALKSKLYRNNKLRQRWQSGDAPASTTPGGASGISQITAGKMSGIAHVITQYEYDTDAFPQGLPQSMWVAKGVKLYDPRRDSTYPGGSGGQRVDHPSTWTYSENPYLAALQWTLGRYENGKRVYGIGAKWSEVDVASFVAGANTADANGWKVGGQVTTGDDKFAVLASLLVAGGGQAIARGAQIACVVNSPKASILTLTREDIVGDAEIASSTSWRDRQNSIIPRYREESQNWEIISGERVSAAQYVTEDDGETKTVEIEFPLVQQAFQAHQLAAYELVNSREMLTFTLKCKMRALSARVGDAITIDIPEFATSAQKALVVGREFSTVDQSVVLSVKSETDAKHAFSLGQTQVAPPSPKLDGYDPSAPDAPEQNAWSITATQISNASTTIPALVVSGASDDPNTRVIIVEYRPVGSSVWLSAGDYPANTTRVEITSVTAGTAYEVAVSYRTVLNVVGERLILNATAGALTISYGTNLSGQPQNLTDINAGEGGKLSGIAPGADVTGTNTSKDTNAVGGVPSGTVISNVNLALSNQRDASGNLILIRDIQTSIADANGRITTANNDISAANVRISNAITKADSAILMANSAAQDASTLSTSVNTRFTDVNTTTGSLSTRITAVSDANGALAVRTSTLETDSSSAKTRLTSVETAVSDGRFATAQRATNLETSVSGLTGRVGTVETAVTDGRFATAQRATNIESSVGSLTGRVSTVETATTDGRFATSQRASNIEASVSGVSGRVSTVETATTDGRFAASGTVTTLRSEYDATKATVTTQAGTITGLQTRTSAYWQTEAVANGNRAQLSVHADANGGAGVDIIGDVSIRGATSAGVLNLAGTGIDLYDQNNVRRVRIGL